MDATLTLTLTGHSGVFGHGQNPAMVFLTVWWDLIHVEIVTSNYFTLFIGGNIRRIGEVEVVARFIGLNGLLGVVFLDPLELEKTCGAVRSSPEESFFCIIVIGSRAPCMINVRQVLM
mmetsp:Transcript_18620/g.31397  ORF Transcript_18620/g.31397 Transcript_18620/m.31397 type:complete len:118 (+) Transcript_18620:1101-1454(+)